MYNLHIKTKDIDTGAREFLSTEGAALLDVRTPEEYAEGHFVHCRSGGRSALVTSILRQMGYTSEKISAALCHIAERW